MTQRILGGIAVILAAVIVISTLTRSPGGTSPRPPENASSPRPSDGGLQDAVPTPAPVGRAPRLAPHPNALTAAPVTTPTIDLAGRLAVRRRIERERTAVYLDSMLAITDSTVTRWPDRRGAPLRYAFTPDTANAAITPAVLDAVRGGFAAWNGNPAGLRFVETANTDEAEIVVSFVESVSSDGEFGVTSLNWDSDGAATRAEIRLALRSASEGPVLSSTVMRRVATHELGHALGLPHSGSRNDIMFPSSGANAPSRRDLATLQLLYALPPGSVKLP